MVSKKHSQFLKLSKFKYISKHLKSKMYINCHENLYRAKKDIKNMSNKLPPKTTAAVAPITPKKGEYIGASSAILKFFCVV